jgi:hypothetical protein
MSSSSKQLRTANHLSHRNDNACLFPGSFVVLQGSSGDGMANSLEVLPEVLGGRRGSLDRVLEEVEEVDLERGEFGWISSVVELFCGVIFCKYKLELELFLLLLAK